MLFEVSHKKLMVLEIQAANRKKKRKISQFFTFFPMLHHEIWLANLIFGFSTPKR